MNNDRGRAHGGRIFPAPGPKTPHRVGPISTPNLSAGNVSRRPQSTPIPAPFAASHPASPHSRRCRHPAVPGTVWWFARPVRAIRRRRRSIDGDPLLSVSDADARTHMSGPADLGHARCSAPARCCAGSPSRGAVPGASVPDAGSTGYARRFVVSAVDRDDPLRAGPPRGECACAAHASTRDEDRAAPRGCRWPPRPLAGPGPGQTRPRPGCCLVAPPPSTRPPPAVTPRYSAHARSRGRRGTPPAVTPRYSAHARSPRPGGTPPAVTPRYSQERPLDSRGTNTVAAPDAAPSGRSARAVAPPSGANAPGTAPRDGGPARPRTAHARCRGRRSRPVHAGKRTSAEH